MAVPSLHFTLAVIAPWTAAGREIREQPVSQWPSALGLHPARGIARDRTPLLGAEALLQDLGHRWRPEPELLADRFERRACSPTRHDPGVSVLRVSLGARWQLRRHALGAENRPRFGRLGTQKRRLSAPLRERV
jgi:hypothetical protein